MACGTAVRTVPRGANSDAEDAHRPCPRPSPPYAYRQRTSRVSDNAPPDLRNSAEGLAKTGHRGFRGRRTAYRVFSFEQYSDPDLWEFENYEARIREAYGKRNALLHSGKRDSITERDLAFTDHLVLNLLLNLVGNPRPFGSKDDVVRFSERVEAERVLGVRACFARPKVKVSLSVVLY